MVQVVEITAMWNLNGDDIKTAKDELESRRATLKAEYEAEVKRIDAELADIDAVERVAVTFVSSRKGDKPASARKTSRLAKRARWSRRDRAGACASAPCRKPRLPTSRRLPPSAGSDRHLSPRRAIIAGWQAPRTALAPAITGKRHRSPSMSASACATPPARR